MTTNFNPITGRPYYNSFFSLILIFSLPLPLREWYIPHLCGIIVKFMLGRTREADICGRGGKLRNIPTMVPTLDTSLDARVPIVANFRIHSAIVGVVVLLSSSSSCEKAFGRLFVSRYRQQSNVDARSDVTLINYKSFLPPTSLAHGSFCL